MLAFPSMLLDAADAAGIKHPPENEVDNESYNRLEYPHWHVLCLTQLSRPMSHGEHFDSAKMLAKIPVDELKRMTADDLRKAGVNC